MDLVINSTDPTASQAETADQVFTPSGEPSDIRSSESGRGWYNRSEGGLVSRRGMMQQQGLQYIPKKRRARKIPQTGVGPLDDVEGFSGIDSEDQSHHPGERFISRGGDSKWWRKNRQQGMLTNEGEIAGVSRDYWSNQPTEQPERFTKRMDRIEKYMTQMQQKQIGQMKDVIDKIEPNNILKMVKSADDVEGTTASTMLGLLAGKTVYGAVIVAAISAIITAPEVIKTIIKMLAEKGSPLNADFHRLFEEEVSGLLTLEDQAKRAAGKDSFIVAQTFGFSPTSGDTYNSLYNRDSLRLAMRSQESKGEG